MKFKRRNKMEMKWIGYQVLTMFKSPYYFLKLFRGVKHKIYDVITDFDVSVLKSKEPIPFNERLNFPYEPINCGDKWGGFFDCAWFEMKAVVPSDVVGKHIVAIIDTQGEGCVMDSEGTPLKGFSKIMSVSTGLNTVGGRKTYDVIECSKGNEEVELFIEAGNNGFMNMNVGSAKLKRAQLAIVNDKVYDLYFDMLSVFTLLTSQKRDSESYKEISGVLLRAFKVLKDYSDDEILRAREILREILSKESEEDFTYYATGHSHLDLAWLWPIRETKRKGGRTFVNQLNLIDKYPEYIYCASQPQLYKWMKELYPKLYLRIKKAIADGRIEPVGGMWVEPDCNLPSGEAMVRQFLYGKRFMRQEFNKEMDIAFLPDVFGFTGALPQIMAKSGVKYFLTIKLSWNEYNEFPYTSFIWKGLDGSEVMAHMPPAGNYNADLTPYYINKTASNNKNKDVKIASILYGAGDGGGGPSEVETEMLARHKNLRGVKKLVSSTVSGFFNALEGYRDRLPVHSGELYLEKHNGTYTTQAKTKYYNRRLENELHKAESLASYAYLRYGVAYPHEKFNNIWEEVLLYQFHDILPGSSIKRVYDECVPRYRALLDELKEIEESILSSFTKSDKPCIYNPTAFYLNEYLSLEGKNYQIQAKPYSSAALIPINRVEGLSFTDERISSDYIEVIFNNNGGIKSLKLKGSDKEYVNGAFNRLTVYKDKKLNFNAWDIDPSYIDNPLGSFTLLSSKTFIDGVKVIRRNVMSFNKSKLTQDIVLTLGCSYLEFVTTVDWRESLSMMRADFEPNITSDEVVCDMQFGNIKRSTSTADSKGYAQYEIPAHKWVNLIEDEHAVAIISDSKYGYRVKDGLMSLNLLRSTVRPDKTADRGEQTFRYAVYPHLIKESELIKLGYAFNQPYQLLPRGEVINGLFSVDNIGVILETIKKAEDYDGVIVRMYECFGERAEARLKTNIKGYKAYLTNMIEDIIEPVDIDKMDFAPFEVKTILLMI